jgi:hypothetical protein
VLGDSQHSKKQSAVSVVCPAEPMMCALMWLVLHANGWMNSLNYNIRFLTDDPSALNMTCVLICDDDRTRGHLMYILREKPQKWSGSGAHASGLSFSLCWRFLALLSRVFQHTFKDQTRRIVCTSWNPMTEPTTQFEGIRPMSRGGPPEKFHEAAYTN